MLITGFMSNDNLVNIKRLVPLVDFIRHVEENPETPSPASDGSGDFRSVGGDYLARCPLHKEKTPSFRIYTSEDHGEDRYQCFGCGAQGDHFRYLEARMGLSFKESLQYLRENFPQVSPFIGSYANNGRHKEKTKVEFDLDSPRRGLVLEILEFSQEYLREQLKINSSLNARKAREYLASKDISDVADEFGIGLMPSNDVLFLRIADEFGSRGFNPYLLMREAGLMGESDFSIFSNRITFPLRTVGGSILGFNGRIHSPGIGPKYKNPPESLVFSKRNILYGLDHLDLKSVRGGYLYLVEGITDTFGFLKQGLNSCLSIGSTTLTPAHIGLIDELNPRDLVIVTDGDVPGIMGAIKNANRLKASGISASQHVGIVSLPEDEDPFDLFFTEGINIEKYVKEEVLAPSQFLNLNLGSLVRHHQEVTMQRTLDSFLTNHTFHIMGKDHLDQLFIKETGRLILEQRATRIKPEKPHPFLLQKGKI